MSFAYICPNCGKAVAYQTDEPRRCKTCDAYTVPLQKIYGRNIRYFEIGGIRDE